MSTAIRCDRCGTIVEPNEVYARVVFSPYANGEPHGGSVKDLCEMCAGHVGRVLLADCRPVKGVVK